MSTGSRSVRVLAVAALVVATVGCASQKDGRSAPPDDAGADSSLDSSPETPPFTPDACKASLQAGATATATIGEGQVVFKDLPDDKVVEWEKGPQGGHHVWIALRMQGLRQADTLSTIDVDDIERTPEVKLVSSRVKFDFERYVGGGCALPGLRMQLDITVPLASIANHRVRVTAKLRDTDGATATAVKTIVVTGRVD